MYIIKFKKAEIYQNLNSKAKSIGVPFILNYNKNNIWRFRYNKDDAGINPDAIMAKGISITIEM